MLAASPAFAEAPPRVRGIVTEIDNGSITVRQRDGNVVTLKTGVGTRYADVVSAALEAIRLNDFVGSAVKEAPNAMVAVELVIIPKGMRAGRISHYGWDPLPDTTGPHTSGTIATSMTNGIVSAETASAAGRTLSVTYDGGRSFRITMPPTAPITRFVPADRSAVAIGSSVSIKTDPGDRTALVAVGKGITPPM